MRRSDCEQVICESWESTLHGGGFDQLFAGIKSCEMGLQTWASDETLNRRKQIKRLQEQIHTPRQATQTEERIQEIHDLQKELEHVYVDEGLYWRQRCKVTWMKKGDGNTDFFHSKATSRRHRNLITGLRDSQGQWSEDPKVIDGIMQTYFGQLFASSNPDPLEIDEVLERLVPCVSLKMQMSLPFSLVEVTRALSQMGPLKSPGPDGFPAAFKKKYWHILGSNIAACVLNFLNEGVLPSNLNFTFIVLIPKVAKPERITKFRPISLCNVIYKIGSKVIANRVKPFLDNIISPTQSAFVPRRLIAIPCWSLLR